MSLLWFSLGSATWIASEYAIHRFVGHGPLRAAPKGWGRLAPSGIAAAFNVEHVAHHTNTSYFAPTTHKLGAAAATIPTVTALMTPFVGLRRAASFGVGFSAMYGTYEFLHRRIHTHPPKNAYGRWLRRHHLLHHHKSPRMNHGVTTDLLDRVFGTLTPLEKVRIPWQSPPPWLVDEKGAVRPEFADDYELSARRPERVGAQKPAVGQA